jgi:DNA-binding MarR family transcriptional regulator
MTDAHRQLNFNEYLPCRLAAVSSSVIRSIASIFEDCCDISIPEWKVLDTVARHPRLSAVDVAQHAGLDTVAVSRAVTRLMDAGRICREFGREDRRRSILELSDEGRILHEKITPMAARLEATLLEDLSDVERRALATALESLSAKAAEFAQAFEATKSAGFIGDEGGAFRNGATHLPNTPTTEGRGLTMASAAAQRLALSVRQRGYG